MLGTWAGLKPYIDPQRYEEVLEKLSTHKAHALEWLQVCLTYFQRFSRRSIPEDVSGSAVREA